MILKVLSKKNMFQPWNNHYGCLSLRHKVVECKNKNLPALQSNKKT